MTKTVSLSSGRTFASLSAAKQHFTKILNLQDINQAYAGDELSEILEIYLGYCTKTGWKLQSTPKSFYPTLDRNPGFTTRCYGVTFEYGSHDSFSMEKALRAIAT